MQGALAFANKVAALRPLPKVRDIAIDCPDHAAFFASARSRVKAAAGPFPAPSQCVEAVAAAVGMQFEDGLKFERDLFMALVQTTESKSLRHAFFSERAAGRFPMCQPIPRCARSARSRSSAPARWAAGSR